MNTSIEEVARSIRERRPDKLSRTDIQSLLQSNELSRFLKRHLVSQCDRQVRFAEVCAELVEALSEDRFWPQFIAQILPSWTHDIVHKVYWANNGHLGKVFNERVLPNYASVMRDDSVTEAYQVRRLMPHRVPSERVKTLLADAARHYKSCLSREHVKAFLSAFFEFARHRLNGYEQRDIRANYLDQRQLEMAGRARYQEPADFLRKRDDRRKGEFLTSAWADKVSDVWKSGWFVEFLQSDAGNAALKTCCPSGRPLCEMLLDGHGNGDMPTPGHRAVACELARYIARSTFPRLGGARGNGDNPFDGPHQERCPTTHACPFSTGSMRPLCWRLWRIDYFAAAALETPEG